MLEAPLGETSTDGDRANEILTPFVPRLVIDWLRESPDDLYREVEGTMAFVDISGFTALSERLARKGKIGAELMRDTLNGVFIALLDTAYDYGAGLLKWGGDALLLLFDGPDHESRACRACWEMQRTLDRVGRLKTGSSTIVLRMSIGISTGTFQFFLTGSVHRELLIAGPDATETVTMEGIADAGEIVVSRRLAARLDPRCIGEPKDISILLARPPEIAPTRAPDVGDVRGLDLPMCVPVAVRAHVMLERSEPEHRTITAAFIDIMDTDAQLERLGIDGLGQALDARIRTIQEVALHYEVPFYESDIGKSSVKALLTAGAPSSTGRDEERMLRALREIIETPGDVQMRIGVNTGRVFTGDFGPSYRRSYRVFGDAINTAARVMSKAEAGQILATEIVLERSRTAFTTAPIEPFAAKGKSEPIRASVVGPILGQRVSEMTETPLVGREREFATLLRLVEEARKSSGWIVEISGAPGLGKTRLVQDVLAHAADVSVFHTRCEEYEASTPYFPLRAPFRALLDLSPRDSAIVVGERLRASAQQVDPALVPWVPLLGILLGVDIPDTPETQALDERFIRDRLADVITRFVYGSLAGTTTALVVEDAQHMDESSRDLVRHLARAGIDRKQMLFVTHDGTGSLFDQTGKDELRTVSLTLVPLSVPAAIAMVNAATEADPLSPHIVEEIARRSSGSPLFLFELLDLVRRTGSVSSLPESVEAVVAADIDELSPADRTVLRYAAVLGTRFDPSLLAAALDQEIDLDEGIWDRLRDLVDREEATGERRFRNTLIRDAAYEGLPFRRRRALHARIAEAIEATAGEDDVGALALHYSEAQRYHEAWHYCLAAAEKARAIFANVEAAQFYERALTASQRIHTLEGRERAATWTSLGLVLEAAGLFAASFEAFRRATRLLREDRIEQAKLYELRARSRARTGSFGAAMRETATGLRLVAGDASKDAAAARALLGARRCEVRWQQGHPREAIEIAKAAIRDAKRAGEMDALATAYTAMDGAYQMLGQPQSAVHDRLALEIYEQLGRTRTVATIESNLGVQAYSEGRWDDAIAWYRRAQGHSLESGDLRGSAVAGVNLAEVLVSRGAYDEAELILPDARRVLRAAGRIPFALLAEMQQTRIMVARGELPRGLEALSRIFDEAKGIDHSGAILEAGIYYAHALAQAGDAEKGLMQLAMAASTAGDEVAYYAAPLARAEATCLLTLSRLVEARERVDSAVAEAERQQMLYEQLLALRTRTEIMVKMDDDVPPEELREADRLAQLLGLSG